MIKEGFNSSPLEIKISASKGESAELWIDQTGLSEERKKTLSYVSLQELVALRDMVEAAILDTIGINS